MSREWIADTNHRLSLRNQNGKQPGRTERYPCPSATTLESPSRRPDCAYRVCGGWYGDLPRWKDPANGPSGDILLDAPICDAGTGAWRVVRVSAPHSLVLLSLPHAQREGSTARRYSCPRDSDP